MRSRVISAAALLALAPVATGCGGRKAPSATMQVRTTVERYGQASADKDYQAICDELITPQLANTSEAIGLPCELAFEKGLKDVTGLSLTVGRIAVTGKRATAAVHTSATGQQPADVTLRLLDTDEGWRIASTG